MVRVFYLLKSVKKAESTLLSPLEPCCSYLGSVDFYVVALMNVISFSFILLRTTTQPVSQSFTNGFEVDENQNGSGD